MLSLVVLEMDQDENEDLDTDGVTVLSAAGAKASACWFKEENNDDAIARDRILKRAGGRERFFDILDAGCG